MKFPGRNQRGPGPYEGVAHGREIKVDNSRDGYEDDGNVAWPEGIEEASRQWPRANADDFERTGKRTYTDRATGVEYVQVSGAPVLGIGTEATRFISVFFVDETVGRLIFLKRADVEERMFVHHGAVTSRQVTMGEPIPGEAIY